LQQDLILAFELLVQQIFFAVSVISGFRCEADENCTLLGCYAT
jgi:hypothetical protein